MANKYHIRSNSFPSASHPSTTRIEEQLSNLKTFEATSTSTSESCSTSLSVLQDLYICLVDLLNLASTRKLISQYKDEKFMEEVLDGSGESNIERSVAEYNFFTKKVKKNAKKLITSLKQMDSQFGVSLPLNQDQDLAALIRVLREVIAMNMSIFQSILSFLAFPSSKSKITKWLMVAKLMQVNSDNSNELHSVDTTLSTLLSDGTSVEKMQATREKLEALENVIEIIENGLESLFRHLIKTRASLLNTMTQ
ncbi:hypothetical protein Lalb_Chr05g0212001 [Lupinus albus]|uniref:Uncharacterized protein n=1 Tax=Lupinus albus TaxID=3870 RepID=A0A6A4QGV3_LUPAL|nr:hypothetical protein Lalb_Chr05g0212001 [Lupinus albus]